MKKAFRILLVVFGLAGVALLSGFASGDDNRAGLAKDFTCGMMDGYGGFVITYTDIAVITHGGTQSLTCHATGVPTPGYVVKYSGFLCGTYWGLTLNSYEVVSALGDAMIRCQIKK